MTNISAGTKFHGVAASVPTSDKKSATLNALSEAYTIDDMVNYIGAKGLFSQTEDGPAVTNTTNELSIIGNGEGGLSVPANGFTKGSSFRVYIEGHLSSLNNANLTINIMDNGNMLATTGPMTLETTSGNYYYLDITFVVRDIGAAGVASLMTSGMFQYIKTSNNTPRTIGFNNLNNTTFDTTTLSTLDIAAQWGAANQANLIDTHILTLQRIF